MMPGVRAARGDLRVIPAPGQSSEDPPATARIIPFPRPLESRWLERVAVFDDDVRFIRYVERVLSMERIETVPITTFDAGEAVRVAAESGCNAALVDLRMYNDPAAGFAFVQALREDPRTSNLPVCLVTGELTELKRRRDLIDHYGCSVLPKPFTPDDLLGVLGLTAAPERTLAPAPVMPRSMSPAVEF
jgi:CheY-like chemotaxis protein